MSNVDDVVLTRLGDTVDNVVVIEWLVAVGDVVAVGDGLVRVETDKVEVDVESPYAGTVAELLAEEGDEVATGSTLCRIAPA
jgi:pyruvate/2-oxoglutarate dehydrogenase complex dihydrolipoamide acyltransferase (E2) component